MDTLMNDDYKNTNRTGLPSAKISPEGGEGVYVGDILPNRDMEDKCLGSWKTSTKVLKQEKANEDRKLRVKGKRVTFITVLGGGGIRLHRALCVANQVLP